MSAALSYVRGLIEPPLLEMTIGEALDRAASEWPDGLALVSRRQNVRWTWSELARRTESVAAGLLSIGMSRGDRIGIWSPNCAEWLITQLAAAKLGLILVTINPAYRLSELEYTLNKVGVKALVTADRFKSSDYAAMLEELAPEAQTSPEGQLRSARLPHLKALITLGARRPGWIAFSDLLSRPDRELSQAVAAASASLHPRDAINIQFTSGTTGAPKGATLSHRNILNNAYFVGLSMVLTAADRLCIPVPLYHCFGMVMGNLACLIHGAAMVYPSEVFEPDAVLEAIEGEGCTAIYGVPTMFIALLQHPEFDRFDVSTLRTGCMAGSPCPVEVMKQVVDRLGARDVTIAYGMTETSPVSFQTSTSDPLERRVSSIGRVQPHLEVKIVDAQGQVTPRSVPGEICTRGYSVMLGYWDDPERTEEAIDSDGWMHTGDVGIIDQDGYGNIVGRIKDMVIRGGENLYPREIEEFLFSHPKIAEVQVVGVPDPRYGEELCAWIRLRSSETATEDEVRDYCRGRIAHQKIPRYVRFVDEFPTTVTGKIQKHLIREAMIRELNLSTERTA